MARFLQTNFRNVFATQLRMSSEKVGGTFGKKQASKEEMYFKRKEQEQLASLKQHHQEEIDHHKKEIDRLQKEIKRHEGKIKELKG